MIAAGVPGDTCVDPALAEAVRRAYVRPVDAALAARHAAALAAAARGTGARGMPAAGARRGCDPGAGAARRSRSARR